MADYGRVISAKVFIDWDFDDAFTEETAYLIRADGQLRFNPPGTGIWSGTGIVDRCTLTLENSTGRFSPLNSGGALYTDIRDGKAYNAPMYIEVSINNAANYYKVFTGVIKIPSETGSTSTETATVTIDCRSNEDSVLSKRVSTSAANFIARHNLDYGEADYIANVLIDAGIDIGQQNLDASTLVVPWMWTDDESPIEACWKLAASAGGRFYCSPNGKYVYDNARAWLENASSTSSQATLTTADFQRLQPVYNDRQLYETVTVVSTPRETVIEETLWASDIVYTIPPGETVVIEAVFDDPAFSIEGALFDAVSSGGLNMFTDVALSQTNLVARASLSFLNNHADQAAIVQNIVVTGQPVTSAHNAEKVAESVDSFWNNREGRGRKLSGNQWVQTQAHLSFLSEFLLDRHETPRLFWQVKGVQGDPQRRLGDRITLNDASMSVSSVDAFVIAIVWRFAAGGPFTQDYESVDATDLFQYIDADPDYFIIGTDKLGAGSSPTGRVFY